MRFDLGHFTPGRSQSAQLVIRLSSTTVPHPIGTPGQPSDSSPLALVPLLPNNALPYAIYFCPAQARQVILRDGIRPRRKSSSSTSSAVKVLPSPTPDPFFIVGGHPLRGNTEITSPSLSTLRIIAMALTRSRSPRNISSLPLPSLLLEYNRTGLLRALL